MPFVKEKRGAKKDNQHAAKGIQPEPIITDSYVAVVSRGLVATKGRAYYYNSNIIVILCNIM